jgi:hypothetical protein
VRLASLLIACVVAPFALSCSSENGDPHSAHGVPPASGDGKRIRDLRDPSVPGQAEQVGASHSVTGAVVIAVDSFDETGGGATGTIYVQDLVSAPFSGLTLFAPTFNPGNLRVGPGDVLDMRGEYQELKQIPSTPPVIFAPGAVLPQIVRPVATFRYETRLPTPVDIDVNDLADYAKGRQWLGMLVRVKNVELQEDALPESERSGRLAVDLLPRAPNAQNACDAPFPKVPELTNDLFNLASLGLTKGTKLKSVVGVVGFFCSMKLAPRSPADIER